MARIRPGNANRQDRHRAMPQGLFPVVSPFVSPCSLLGSFLPVIVCAMCVLAPCASLADSSVPLSDSSAVWFADDARPVPVPEFEEPGLIPYGYESFVARPFSRFWHPGRALRWLVTRDNVQEAANLNALDEVVDSSWFTNRIGMRPLTEQELTAGSGLDDDLAAGPDRGAPWVIIGAKTSGVTPGFRIRDARGDIWLLKFDPPEHPGITIRAGVVSNLLFHAMGFHVPVDRLVRFDRNELVVGEGAKMRLKRGQEVSMSEANLDSVLVSTGSVFGGRYHALASRYLDGLPLGPFDDQGRRAGDPNDTIRHENRRELRALQVFGAWVNHYDTKAHNSLDMYVGEPGKGYVRHHLIDFASTLGAFGDQSVPRYGHEFGFDVFPILGRALTLGLVDDAWAGLERPPGLDEIGLFDVESFRPGKWKPDLPNSQMANLTRLDGYWAAKIISAFTEDDLRVIVRQGDYQDPRSEEYLVSTLLARQEKIVRYWFELVPPLDFFQPTPEGIWFQDLATKRGFLPLAGTSYRYRLSAVDSQRQGSGWCDWVVTDSSFILLTENPEGNWREIFSRIPGGNLESPFLAIECQVNRGTGWSSLTTVYRAFGSGTIVALDR
ncbi:MAG: hypothetical protein KOO60_03730 [Gemmatimonadales bacterium]|nr:hypothetical protein [Gemmatimonadales bacterium]